MFYSQAIVKVFRLKNKQCSVLTVDKFLLHPIHLQGV